MPSKKASKAAPPKPKLQHNVKAEPAASSITDPIDDGEEPIRENVPKSIYDPTDKDQDNAITRLAIQLCLAEGHRNPFSYQYGRPKFMANWSMARALIVALIFMNRTMEAADAE